MVEIFLPLIQQTARDMKTNGKKYTAKFTSDGKLLVQENGITVFTMIGDCSAISKQQENAIVQAIAHKINFN